MAAVVRIASAFFLAIYGAAVAPYPVQAEAEKTLDERKQAVLAYNTVLNRRPTDDEVRLAAGRLSPKAPSAVLFFCLSLAGSREFLDKINSKTNDRERVDLLYKSILKRKADPYGLSYWSPRVREMKTLLEQLMGSWEFRSRLLSSAMFMSSEELGACYPAIETYGRTRTRESFDELKRFALTSKLPPFEYTEIADSITSPAEKLAFIERGLKYWPDDPLLRTYKGTIYFEQKKMKQANAELKIAERYWPENRSLREINARALASMGEFKEAIAECLRASDRAEGRKLSIDLIMGHMVKREYDNSLEMLNELYAKGIRDEAVLRMRAECLTQTEQFERALADLNAIIASHSANTADFRSRGRCNMVLGRLDPAVSDLSTSIKLSPCAFNYRLRAEAYIRKKMFVDAEKDLSKAIEMEPRAYDSYVERARLRQRTGNARGALQDLNVAAKLAPRSADVFELRARVNRTLHNFSAATLDDRKAHELGTAWENKTVEELLLHR